MIDLSVCDKFCIWYFTKGRPGKREKEIENEEEKKKTGTNVKVTESVSWFEKKRVTQLF